MKQPVNRIEAEITNWKVKEQRLAGMFSTALLASTEFQKEKLAFYEQLSSSFGNGRGLGEQERFSLRMARAEKGRLEKQLYPSLLVRLVRSGLKGIFKPVIDHKREVYMASNERHLIGVMAKMGLDDTSGSLAKQMRRGERQFQLPVTTYIENGKRVDFELDFHLESNGQYALSEYKVAIKTEGQDGVRQSFSCKHFPELNAQQVGNLLEGRAVQQGGKWLQLDQNDKDTDGNYRMKQFHPGYGFDLEKVLAQWPVRELKNQDLKQHVLDALRQGNKVQVTLQTRGKHELVNLEVNPQFKAVTVLGHNGEKISLAQALGKQKTQQQRSFSLQSNPTIRVSRGRNLSVG